MAHTELKGSGMITVILDGGSGDYITLKDLPLMVSTGSIMQLLIKSSSESIAPTAGISQRCLSSHCSISRYLPPG